MRAAAFGEETGEGRVHFRRALEFHETNEHAGGLRGREVFDEAAAASRPQPREQAEEGQPRAEHRQPGSEVTHRPWL
ncbi:MAG: hypothetical protein EB082_15135 [Verrucomicrobia bacterium]|nr:hypothetical protein [Verrucomicrobiota bacterium]